MTSGPIPAIRTLPTGLLKDLAQAFRNGVIPGTASSFTIRRAVSGVGEPAAAELAMLLSSGLGVGHSALLLDTLVAERSSAAHCIELVTSGPDAAAITRDTGVVLREMFAAAERRVLVVGFTVYQGREIFAVLAQQMHARPDLSVRLCLDVQRRPGDTSRSDVLLRRFADHFVRREWPGPRMPDIFYDPRSLSESDSVRASLHAKCVVVDGREAFVGSANFTEAAQLRNIEVGVVLFGDVADTAERHFTGLIERGHLLPLSLAQ